MGSHRQCRDGILTGNGWTGYSMSAHPYPHQFGNTTILQGEKSMDMSEQSELPRRRSLRLPQHNYRWTASYFVTIRSEHHEPVFDMPELRAIVEEGWQALPARFPHVELDTFIVMPDHIHGILHFTVTNAKSPSLGSVIGAYHSLIPTCNAASASSYAQQVGSESINLHRRMVALCENASCFLVWPPLATRFP